MAESGFFRTEFRGFKKQDVLQYIDNLQSTHGERLAESEELRRQAEQALEAAHADSVATEELKKQNADLADQVEKLTALAKIYKTELLALREEKTSFEQVKTNREQLDETLARNKELEERCAQLEAQNALVREQNARYAAVVGDVSRLVVEARVVSASYLDAAHQKSTECIQHLDEFLAELKGEVEKVREDAVANRRAGDVHIESLLSDLQELGKTIDNAN